MRKTIKWWKKLLGLEIINLFTIVGIWVFKYFNYIFKKKKLNEFQS